MKPVYFACPCSAATQSRLSLGRLGWLAALLAAPAARAQTLDWLSAASLNPTSAGGTSLVRGTAADKLVEGKARRSMAEREGAAGGYIQ